MNPTDRPVRDALPEEARVDCGSMPALRYQVQLQPDMIGKSMRRPNLDCRQVFTVQQQAREIEPPKSEPVPVPAP